MTSQPSYGIAPRRHSLADIGITVLAGKLQTNRIESNQSPGLDCRVACGFSQPGVQLESGPIMKDC